MSTKRLATASKKRGSRGPRSSEGSQPNITGGAIASGGRPVYFVCIPLCFLPCSLPVFVPCTRLPDGSFTRPSCRRLLQWIVRRHFYENAFWSFFDGCRGGKNDQKAFSSILSVGRHCTRPSGHHLIAVGCRSGRATGAGQPRCVSVVPYVPAARRAVCQPRIVSRYFLGVIP